MAKRPFKKYNSRAFVDAVQYTAENEDVLIEKLGAQPTEQERLLLPGIPNAIEVHRSDYIIVHPNGLYGVLSEDDFEEDYRVPKSATDEAEEDDE